MARILYVEKNFRDDSLRQIAAANAIIREYRAQGLRLTLRQLYYQFVSRDLIPNTDRSYKNLGSVISDARIAGMIDWDAIEDRKRRPRTPAEWENLREIVDAAIGSYRLPRWRGQETYAELWVEKDALAGVLEPLASRYHVTLMVNSGYSSQSAMFESAQRFIEKCKRNGNDDEAEAIGTAYENGNEEIADRNADPDSYATDDCDPVDLVRRPVLFYLGDHDPSGEDMVRDVRVRLHMFGVDVSVTKIALNMDQVRQYRPPPNPAKVTDSRYEAYRRKYGDQSWEVDALPPNVLAALISDAFSDVIDVEKMDAVKAQEETDKQKLREAVSEIMNGNDE